jgi:hypothetical protein
MRVTPPLYTAVWSSKRAEEKRSWIGAEAQGPLDEKAFSTEYSAVYGGRKRLLQRKGGIKSTQWTGKKNQAQEKESCVCAPVAEVVVMASLQCLCTGKNGQIQETYDQEHQGYIYRRRAAGAAIAQAPPRLHGYAVRLAAAEAPRES